MWLSKIAEEQYLVDDGRHLPASEISRIIKEKLIHCKTIQGVCKDFEVDPRRIQDIQVEITDLDSRYAETDAYTMRINKNLFDKGHFFRDYFFVVVHEVVHFLSRVKEMESYFQDPEEVLGFVMSIGYELENGSDLDEIWNKVYPKVSFHFNDEADAREFFSKMLEKARKILEGNLQ